jgi:hypothetical protein
LAPDERCRRLEARVRSYVKQLRYLQTFLEAYEAEGWRRASREKLKPSKELATARRKMAKAKRNVVDALHEMDELRQRDPPIPYLVEMETQQPMADPPVEEGEAPQADRIYCSRCSSTVTADDNDILLCDSEGCFRAFHQQCQVPVVTTESIPQGDEQWFCGSCLAIFNALKAINYACDTTHEKIGDVFPELPQEEEALLVDGDYDASTAEGTAEEDEIGQAEDEEEEDDEDFVVDEARAHGDPSDDSSDSGEESGDTSADDGVLESDVSEDELKHLHKDDVIDSTRYVRGLQPSFGFVLNESTRSFYGCCSRSMRSRGDPSKETHQSTTKSYLGRRVAKQNEGGDVVYGVVVEKDEASEAKAPWRVVYFDDSMAYLDEDAVVAGIEMAVANAKHDTEGEGDTVDQSLILGGKRKRSRVDYKALNDLMFAGQEDSDAGGDEHVENGSEEEDDDEAAMTNANDDDDDYVPTNPKAAKASSAAATMNTESAKRGRRSRQQVDYRAMHEGFPGL